jgi:hypothetical protein
MRYDWNVVATSLSGHEASLLSAMDDLGDFEASLFDNVIVGFVEDKTDFMARLSERFATDFRLPRSLGRAVPVETTVAFVGEDPSEYLRAALRDIAGKIGNRPYHLRIDAHGLREHAHELEMQLADTLWDELRGRGFKPCVDFLDPDLVVAIEIVGDVAGIALVDRETRERFPFLKVR